MEVAWVLEPQVFGPTYDAMIEAVRDAGHTLVLWEDGWLEEGNWPRLDGHAVIFHGSLGNAAKIRSELPWRPGVFCDVGAFCCSAWYPKAMQWLLHSPWQIATVKRLVEETDEVLSSIGASDSVFVRPDSPLKPFSGRVLKRSEISLKALDFGFYYEDMNLPVVVAPVRSIAKEWRYVVVRDRVVAGSAYAADGRSALPDEPTGPSWVYASNVAMQIDRPEDVYVMDVCQADDKFHLVELNPFSGADLYACRAGDVVREVSEVVRFVSQQE